MATVGRELPGVQQLGPTRLDLGFSLPFPKPMPKFHQSLQAGEAGCRSAVPGCIRRSDRGARPLNLAVGAAWIGTAGRQRPAGLRLDKTLAIERKSILALEAALAISIRSRRGAPAATGTRTLTGKPGEMGPCCSVIQSQLGDAASSGAQDSGPKGSSYRSSAESSWQATPTGFSNRHRKIGAVRATTENVLIKRRRGDGAAFNFLPATGPA